MYILNDITYLSYNDLTDNIKKKILEIIDSLSHDRHLVLAAYQLLPANIRFITSKLNTWKTYEEHPSHYWIEYLKAFNKYTPEVAVEMDWILEGKPKDPIKFK